MFEIDAGYFYGIGAFETILIKNGSPILIQEHLKRLHKALEFFQINKTITLEEVREYLKLNNIEDGVLKITVSEHNTWYSTRKNAYTQKTYQKGFRLTLSSFKRNETSPLTYHKTLNYAENILAKQEAVNKGYDEALFLNTKGEICEGSSANIFFVKEGQLFTPPIGCGLLPGVFRNYLCTGEKVEECIITMEDIKRFDECFITNSVLGIMKVNAIENQNFGSAAYVNEMRKKYSNYPV